MYFERFYHEGLAQASYLIGCQETGEALVVDANRDLDLYIRAAAAQALRITHVSETHIHADFVSGSRDLARLTGARLLLSGEGTGEWQYGFARESTLLRDGQVFHVGRIAIRALHTPGHTPEHITFLISDTLASKEPLGALTGDFIFVGDVGRPDLLERAAGVSETTRASAEQLYASLQRFVAAQADHLLIWPGHGAGSACGKSLGAVPMSTLGYEKIANWAFQAAGVDSFVSEVLQSQPDPPPYFAVMKRVNRDGPQPLDRSAILERYEGTQRIADLLAAGAMLIDVRPAAAYALGAVPGSINLPLAKSLLARAGWLVPYDRDLYLLAGSESPEAAEAAAITAAKELSLIGLDRVRGWFDFSALAAADAPQTIAQVSVQETAARLRDGGATLIDVRDREEWKKGHIAGALHIPLGTLPQRAESLRNGGKRLVLHCTTGSRSSVAASVLLASGLPDVAQMVGGIEAWRSAGLPVTRDGA